MGALLDEDALERSSVVANASMNRERGLAGTNGYAKDLRFDPAQWLSGRLESQRSVAWLDLCCGSGKALVEAARLFATRGLASRVALVGVDLVPLFVDVPEEVAGLHLVAGSLRSFAPRRRFDLVTCVHGLHYVGDKLDALARAARWLTPTGRLVASFDVSSVRLEGTAEGTATRRAVTAALRRAGFAYEPRQRLVARRGPGAVRFPFRFLGADDGAGPNYTGQPAVTSHYGPRAPARPR